MNTTPKGSLFFHEILPLKTLLGGFFIASAAILPHVPTPWFVGTRRK